MAKTKSILTPKEVESKLRDYQMSAIIKMDGYIRSYDKGDTTSSGLVAMPTGSGKTAIIGSLACCYKRKGKVLVLSPRRAVVEQLFSELSDRLFNEKLVGLINKPTKSVYFEKIDFKAIEDESVICWTIQKLQSVRKREPKLFERLTKEVSLILFDEGHYEPAVTWSEAVRSFKVPRIIFTATPFRNDFKKFDVDWKKSVHKSSYNEILSEKYLREVKVENIGLKSSLISATEDALWRFDKIKTKKGSQRLIIKCDSSDTILEISRLLKDAGRDFISIHERFNTTFKPKDDDLATHLFQAVPDDQDKLTEEIWVHQYKLVEGIDSSKFQCLAIVEKLSNTRAFIQQVGRIIRNPERNNDKGYVYNYTEEDYKSVWDQFIALDGSVDIKKSLSERIIEEITDRLEDYEYLDKRIRKKLTEQDFISWNEDDLKEHLQLPLKANFIKTLKGFDIKNLINKFLDPHFKEKDHVYYKNIFGPKSGLYLYFNIGNSPFLRQTFFPELTHHVCFFKQEKDYLIFLDTGKLLPLGLDEHNLGYGIETDTLRSVFKESSDTILNRVSLKNSNLGSSEPHSYSYWAGSIEDTTPHLNDFSHFLSSAYGYYRDKKVYKDYKDKKLKDKEFLIPTYIGFGTGRISQSEGKYVNFKEYLQWIKYINDSIKKKSSHVDIFNRYATEITNKSDEKPLCIQLDLFDFEKTHELVLGEFTDEINDGMEEKSRVMETYYLLSKKRAKPYHYFNLKFDEREFEVKVKYDDKRNRYLLESPELSLKLGATERKEAQKVVDLIKAINKKQCFRILTKKGLSYSGGRFYEPHFNFGENFNQSLSPLPKMLNTIPKLDTVYFSEKGDKNGKNSNEWRNDSLFHLLSIRGKGSKLKDHFFESSSEKEELLICTDLRTEPADFIFVSNKKIAFIHVKGKGNDKAKAEKKKSKYGATPLADVCNQAIKNAHYLSIFDDSIPKNINDWSKKWNPNKTYNVDNRIRTSTLPKGVKKSDPKSIWNFISEKKMDVNISKEIWLVMGYTFNKDRFLEEIEKKNPAAEAKQAALSLESTVAHIHSLGIKLKVFCS